MRVIIEQAKCCGAGQCVLAAPDIFDQREDDGIVILLQENPSEESRADVLQAIKVCPALAIRLEG
ncbi:MAG: ferredoxin [Chelatococcus sp.]|jgi:ferredoxin|uniref:ferredoxin n=1 Tax=unclassified Chelatococcus TaxID=2638111 RepID=UPI001BD16DA8|nr:MULTISPECIES: ferredoxin [unclassified Chelatococcus]CAH1653339.1 Ferredoxin-2 [Hyphomicrobiales bacterium]MBS7742914.1 ferredoxin [Chelatococcus sp. HY11]MBX3538946.1 ferredoxin [Chelatococcus sp.]MBX3541968.1 ferredoxin [Chelatococcus sp.]MCO5074140.1 ferredoxin [Chelatococcus sp.]